MRKPRTSFKNFVIYQDNEGREVLKRAMYSMNRCKYYSEHLNTVAEYISCLYSLDGCSCGGLLHILLDDDNYDDNSIMFCLRECILHPEREESKIGKLICEEYLRLPMEQRRMLTRHDLGYQSCFKRGACCEECFIQIGDEYENKT